MRCSITNSAQTGFGKTFLELLSSHYLLCKTQILLLSDHTKRTSDFVLMISNVTAYYPQINQLINELSEHFKIQSYFYLGDFHFIKSDICKRFLSLASSMSKFTLISHHLFIIFYGSSHIFKAIFQGSFP